MVVSTVRAAGSKVLSSDLIGLVGLGAVVGMPDATTPRLDEEHGLVDSAKSPEVRGRR